MKLKNKYSKQYIYIYIYIYREREREKGQLKVWESNLI
jgi:hypothetical protein